ncbi:hypothetical protein FRB99_006661 [Tulasnella sp. 403]|nr:hypothetical protein FRB99_006661 [Tulasnella sp. 403]
MFPAVLTSRKSAESSRTPYPESCSPVSERSYRHSATFTCLPPSVSYGSPTRPNIELCKPVWEVNSPNQIVSVSGEIEVDISMFRRGDHILPFSIGIHFTCDNPLPCDSQNSDGFDDFRGEWNQDGPGNYYRRRSFIVIHPRLVVDDICYVKFTINVPRSLLPQAMESRVFNIAVKAYELGDPYNVTEPSSARFMVLNRLCPNGVQVKRNFFSVTALGLGKWRKTHRYATLQHRTPASDESCECLDYRIEIYEAAWRGLRDEASRQSAVFRRLRNNFAPIHRLPLEIFTNILLQIVHGPASSHNIPRQLRILCQVSSRWYNAIVSCAALWSRISDSFHEDQIGMFLERSGAVPLRIELSRGWSYRHPVQFKALTAQAHRWRGLRYSPWGNVDDWTQYTSLDVPILEDLRIVKYDDRNPFKIDCIPDAPLQRLDLLATHLPWDSFRLSNLRVLRIIDLIAHEPTTSQLMAMLAAAPMLETLVLLRLGTSSSSTNYTPDAEEEREIYRSWGIPPLCPGLKRLKLRSISVRLTWLLLGRLALGNCRAMYVDNVPLALFDRTIAFDRGAQTLLSTAKEVAIEVVPGVSSGYIYVKSIPCASMDEHDPGATDDGFALKLKGLPGDDVLRPLCDFLAENGPQVPLLLIAGCDRLSSLQQFGTSVHAHPHVRHIIGYLEDVKYLLRRDPDPDGTQDPCPKLEGLSIKGDAVNYDEVARFVKGRWDVQEGEGHEPPRKLDMFQVAAPIRGSTENLIRRLALAPDGVFICSRYLPYLLVED